MGEGGKEKGTERFFQPLVYSPRACNSWDQVRSQEVQISRLGQHLLPPRSFKRIGWETGGTHPGSLLWALGVPKQCHVPAFDRCDLILFPLLPLLEMPSQLFSFSHANIFICCQSRKGSLQTTLHSAFQGMFQRTSGQFPKCLSKSHPRHPFILQIPGPSPELANKNFPEVLRDVSGLGNSESDY